MKSRKVYSPDIVNYSFEGNSGLFRIISSFLVGPLRLVLRVMHNIAVLPAGLQARYAKSLLFTSVIVAFVGLVDYILYRKWPLFLSQVPILFIAFYYFNKTRFYKDVEHAKREVDIDNEQVEAECMAVYEELDKIFREDVNK